MSSAIAARRRAPAAASIRFHSSIAATTLGETAGDTITIKGVTITFKNEGKATHTFTSTALSMDQQVSAGKSAKFTLTVPSTGAAFQFHCNFHEGMGMQGAFYTQAGAKVTAGS